MELLNYDASREEIFDQFPMLEELSETELTMMKEDCEDSEAEEDKPLLRAVEVLLKRMDEDEPQLV